MEPYHEAEIRVELYHSPYEHREGQADPYAYWDDDPAKAVKQLQQQKPYLMFPLSDYEEAVTVGMDYEDDMFGIQELGKIKVSTANTTRLNNGEYPSLPTSAYPHFPPEVKRTVYFEDYQEEDFVMNLKMKELKRINNYE